MSSRTPRTPSYRLHKPTGQAVVTLGGRDVYLGLHGTDASKQAYDRAVAEWLANGRRSPSTQAVAVTDLVAAYREYVAGRYRSSEPANIRVAIRPVREMYGPTPAVDFGPLALKAVRRRFVEVGNCRSLVNRRVGMIVRMFKWAVSEQLVPPSTWEALRSVEGLRANSPGLRESEPVRPVPDAFVDATLPHLSRPLRAMVQLQRLTGARPGEVCSMRTCDLVTSGRVWEYRPATHKTAHRRKSRVVFIGPTAQDVLRPFLRPALTEYLFSPAEAEVERMAALRAARKTKVQPSQTDRARPDARRRPGERYNVASYRRAIARAVEKVNQLRREKDPEADPIPDWHPHQLRHNAATALRREFSLDVARAVLGHSSPVVTEIYAEMDQAKAREAMERMG